MAKFDLLFYRSNDWWRSKLAYAIGYVYLLLYTYHANLIPAVALICPIALTSIGFALLGYAINDYFDQVTDSRAGKPNLMADLSMPQKVLLLSGGVALAFLPWLRLPLDRISIALLFAEILLFIAYSATFIRLKERKILGLISDTLYAHLIPSALIGHTVFLFLALPGERNFMAVVLVWQFFVGLRNIIIHQVEDFSYDKISGVKSWVNQSRGTLIVRTIALLRAAECVAFFCLLAYLYSLQPGIIVVAIVSLAYYCFVLFINGAKSEGIEALSQKFYPNYLYEKILPPLILLLLAITSEWGFAIILVVHLALFNYSEVNLITQKARFHGFNLYLWLKVNVLMPSWVAVKTGGNYAIYYFLRLFGINLVKENTNVVGYFKKRFLPGEKR